MNYSLLSIPNRTYQVTSRLKLRPSHLHSLYPRDHRTNMGRSEVEVMGGFSSQGRGPTMTCNRTRKGTILTTVIMTDR